VKMGRRSEKEEEEVRISEIKVKMRRRLWKLYKLKCEGELKCEEEAKMRRSEKCEKSEIEKKMLK